ncbi:MAG: branched-chain amino acid ABC transporter ATP-binding protein/permease [Casimicrobiaceae bacterium]
MQRDLVLPLLTLAALVFAATANQYHLYLITLAALTVVVGVGLNVLIGLSGQVSLGHVGFYAIGAYAAAVLTASHGWNFWLALPVAMLLNGAIGALLGLFALRVSGPYLAMVTIAFAFIVEYGAIEWKDVTGGANGLINIPPIAVAGWSWSQRALAITTVLVAILALAGYRRLRHSGWGLALRAVRDAEVAAAALGYNPLGTRTFAFALSAALAGAAGAFFAPLTEFIAPSSFSLFQSILFVLVVMIGGAERTYGPVIGAAIVVALPEWLSGLAEYRVLFFGALLLLVLWLAPGGIAGLLARLTDARQRKALPAAAGAAVGAAALPSVSAATLAVRGLGITFGGLRAVDDLGFDAQPGRITSVIGPNGAGKTTAINLIGGFYKPDSGSVTLAGIELAGKPIHVIARAGIARTYQTSQLFGSLTVQENLLAGMAGGRPGNPLAGAANGQVHAVDRAAALAAFVGYTGDLQLSAGALSHVDRRLVEIARALAANPKVLLLDEPAAGLARGDKTQLSTLLRRIADSGVAVVLIEHDMSLVMGISDHVVVLDAGCCIAQGAPEAVRRDAAVIKAYLGEGDFQPRPRAAGWVAPGDGALTVSTLAAGYGGAPVLRGVSLEVNSGELVAMLGANGAGKSTLMRSLSGLLRPVGGEILLVGRNVTRFSAHQVAHAGLVLVPEGRQVFPELSVEDNIRLGAHTRRDYRPEQVDAMLERFPLIERRRRSRAGLLSGGEQQMLAIARGLMAKPRVLLLDEPSLGLAPAIINELFDVLTRLRDEGMTVLLVDQMAALALAIADRAYVLESGDIVAAGAPAVIRGDAALERAYLGET